MKKLILAGVAIALLVAGIDRVELEAQPRQAAQPKKAGVTAELAAKQQAMIVAAQRTLAAFEESFENSKLLQNEVYDWSSRIRSAQLRAADSQQQATKASQEHLQRMQVLHRKIALADEVGVVGPKEKSAVDFYLAEAEVLVLEAKGKENVQLRPRP